jgi:dihydroxyacetone kinase-like protein
MVDALLPALAALKQAVADGQDVRAAVAAAVAAAEQGMKDTIPLQARKGRANYLGDAASPSEPDATSSYLILNALLGVL